MVSDKREILREEEGERKKGKGKDRKGGKGMGRAEWSGGRRKSKGMRECERRG